MTHRPESAAGDSSDLRLRVCEPDLIVVLRKSGIAYTIGRVLRDRVGPLRHGHVPFPERALL